MSVLFENDWNDILKDEFEKEYYQTLRKKLIEEYRTTAVYPDMYDIFNALHLTSFADTKVVIIGQDPYHNKGQAHGLCFSVKPDVEVPPSLQNIYKELHDDLGCAIPNHGYLVKWAQQGVLLLNAVLTVRAHRAGSHRPLGWEQFTDHIIALLNERTDPVVFILWGSFAQSKEPLITNPIHHIIKSAHPSPLSASRGFFGSKPFSRANSYLEQDGKTPIDWCIDPL
jgi:uracil-DNA glycosylase